MSDNIKSTRLDYLSFMCDDTVVKNPYYHQFKKAVIPNTLFLNTRSQKYSFEKVHKIVKALKGKGIQIFVREYFKKDFENVSYVKAVESGSAEYYNAAATSQYIYTDTFLFPDFVKKQEQIVFNDIDMSVKEIKDRINLYVSSQKSDYFIKNKSNKSDLSFRKFIKGLAKNKFNSCDKNDNPDGKTSILYIVNLKYYDLLFDYIKKISRWIDYDKYDITVLYDNYYEECCGDELMALDSRIHLAVKRGHILCSVEDYKKLLFLNKEKYYITDKNNINSFLSENLFVNEAERVLGKCHYNMVINLAYDSFYWNWLANTISSNCQYLDMMDYANKSEDFIFGRLSFLNFYKKHLFLNQDNMDSVLSIDKTLHSRAQLFSYLPQKAPETAKLETLDINSQSYYIINKTAEKNFDSINLELVKVFSKNADYTVLGNRLPFLETQKYVKNLSNECSQLIVFDFFNIISESKQTEFDGDRVIFVRSPIAYSKLLDDLNKCYLCTPVFEAAAFDAINVGKKVLVTDSDCNNIEEKTSSNFSLKI